jgi:hypothetical protein
MTALMLKRASASRPLGEWNDDDYDALADGVVVGRIFNSAARRSAVDVDARLGHHEDRTPPTTRRAKSRLAAFAKSWRRE